MKKSCGILLITVLLAGFAIGMAVTAQANPAPSGECSYACNRTTYQYIECCPYEYNAGGVHVICKVIGKCYVD